MEKSIYELLASWGFSSVAPESVVEHANLILDCKNKSICEIIETIGIAKASEIESLLLRKTAGISELDFLKDSGVRGIASNADLILAIQYRYLFISRTIPSLVLHPTIVSKESKKDLQSKLNSMGVLPMVYDNQLMLLFEDFQKLSAFNSIARSSRYQNALYTLMAEIEGKTPDTVTFKSAVVASNVLIEYQQKFSDVSNSVDDGEDSLQIISQNEADTDPVIGQIVRILNESLKQESNDVALTPNPVNGGAVVYFRKNQKLIPSGITLSAQERDAVTRILTARSKANPSGGRLRHPVDGNAIFHGKLGQAFLRLSFIPLEESQTKSTSVSVRVLPRTSKSITLKSLNIDPELQEELNYYSSRDYGLFIVCGPTNSGKSTTIAGMICEHNRLYGTTMKRVSVEQPCERILPNVSHIDVSQHRYNEQERKSDTDNFGMALRAILRHDPDLINIGEVRDVESCLVAVDAANTGHLVFTTTHANDPILGYRRMASFLTPERRFDLVNILDGILAQRLLTTVCQSCSEEVPLSETDMKNLRRYAVNKGIELDNYNVPARYRKPSSDGCKDCCFGYDGMLPVHGLLTMNPKVRACLLSENVNDWMNAQAASGSKFTLFGSAFKLFQAGRIDLDTVML